MKSLLTQLPEDVEDRFDKLREEIMELFRFQIRKKPPSQEIQCLFVINQEEQAL